MKTLVTLALLAACTHTHHVTPWLVVRIDGPSWIPADSGAPTYRTLRRVSGRWQQVSDLEDTLRISDDRALYYTPSGVVLATASGETIELTACRGWPIASPRAHQLVCVEPQHPNRDFRDGHLPGDGSLPFALARFDLDGRPRGVAHLGLPAGALAPRAAVTLIGMAGDAVVLGVLDGAACTAWIVRGDQVARGGRIAATTTDACSRVDPWRATMPDLIQGERRRDSRGVIHEFW